jgi:hypothetical protein
MTEQEKELIDLIEEVATHGVDIAFRSRDIAKAIIEKYPQIKAKEADRFIRLETGSSINKYNIYSERKVKNIYIEVVE